MKFSGYIIIALWTAALTGTVYLTHTATQGARSELAAMVLGGTDTELATAATPTPATAVARQTPAEVTAENVRAQLASGLVSLKGTLEGYQVKLAQGGTAVSAN